jgi:glycosyltransferase involved in cell wall biosynthesis
VNGWLVEPNNPAALRAAIDMLMADPALRARLGEAAREQIAQRHMPRHYTAAVREALRETS